MSDAIPDAAAFARAAWFAGPGTYATQLDATFGVALPILTTPHLQLRAIGDVYVPLGFGPAATDPAAPLLRSRALRFGIQAIF